MRPNGLKSRFPPNVSDSRSSSDGQYKTFGSTSLVMGISNSLPRKPRHSLPPPIMEPRCRWRLTSNGTPYYQFCLERFHRDTPFGGVDVGKLALPERNDTPTKPCERSARLSVPLAVLADLVLPEFCIRLRQLRTPAAVSVPKTTVHKYRDGMLRQNEVGASREIRAVQSKPEPEAMRSLSRQHFRRRVAIPDRAHVPRSLLSCQVIDHDLLN